MPDLRTRQELFDWADDGEGVLVLPADLANFTTNLDNAIGFLLDALLGGPNGLPAENALAISPSGMNVTVGGTGQIVIAQGRTLDVCPSQTFTVTPNVSASQRVDLIAIQATRVAGSTNVTRNVLASDATPPLTVVTGTMAGGIATIALPTTYAVPPACVASPTGTGSTGDLAITTVSTTEVVVTSSDASDTRGVTVFVFGDPEGSGGTPTTIALQENTAAYQYVTGTPGAGTPAAPSGWESFATVSVSGGQMAIVPANIDVLFPQLPALSDPLTLQKGLTSKGLIYAGDGLNDGAYAAYGVSAANGKIAILPPLFPGALSYGGYIANGAQTVQLLSWDDSGNFTILGNLTVDGAIEATGNISTAGEFIGSGAGLTNIPQSAIASRNPIHNFGALAGGFTGGTSATVTLPNDGHTYNIRVAFNIRGSQQTGFIATPTGGGTSGFVSEQGSGYNSGTVCALAFCKAVGGGQTVSFALSVSLGGGGTVDGGVWEAEAILFS